MNLIVDASAVAGWLMPDESGYDLYDLSARFDDFTAPWLLWAELRNILIVSERRGRLPHGFADQAIEAVDALGIRLDTTPSSVGTMTLARRHKLSVYDALYLEMAIRQQGGLATLDKALAAAARKENVAVI